MAPLQPLKLSMIGASGDGCVIALKRDQRARNIKDRTFVDHLEAFTSKYLFNVWGEGSLSAPFFEFIN